MVAISSSKRDERPSRCGFSLRQITPLLLAVALLLAFYQLQDESKQMTPSSPSQTLRGGSISQAVQQCRFFLAESAIPKSGLGIFTARDIRKDDPSQSMPDICIYVADTPKGTSFETHSWARDVFMGSFEGRKPRAACEGVATLVNSMPDGVRTSQLTSMKIHTNGGLRRDRHAGAGAITHYYGIDSKALRDVPAGAEVTIDYGDWEYSKKKKYEAPMRTPRWLQKHGMCIDHIEIRTATDPSMGRGAFARRDLPKGELVAPAPLQAFPSRQTFAQQEPEALFVNYCFQPRNSDVLFFPYGPGVNLINHRHREPNVGLRWSSSSMHHAQWLDLPLQDFWKVMYPGALVLEVVALRDIGQGEELFLDYGIEWEVAWNKHVKQWKPIKSDYAYPADMDLKQPFRTLEEQETKPYAPNLATACFEEDWDRNEGRQEWTAPKFWPEGLTYCHILKRDKNADGSYLYEVSLGWGKRPHARDNTKYIDTNVPQSAIMFVDKPYQSDMHLPKAFRHPIAMPDPLLPSQWKQHSAK